MTIRHAEVQQRKASGLTLVEVLVATSLFLVATFGLLAVFPTQNRAIGLSHDVLTATSLADREIESTVALGFSVAANRTAQETVSGVVNGVAVSQTFTCETRVTSVSSQLSDVVVRVRWTEGGRSHVVSLETLLAAGP